MKYIFVLFTLLVTASIFGQIELYGDYTGRINGYIPDDDDYTSLLNPGNYIGINDLNLEHLLTIKLAGSDDIANMEIWFSGSLTPLDDDIDYSLDLQRASVNWYLGDALRIKVGRQSMLTGYGYGWNPIDFANSIKDPTDPDADLTGVDALLLHLFPYSSVNLKLYGILEEGYISSGVDYEEILFGGEVTAVIPYSEFKITGFYDRDDTEGEDARVSGAGIGALFDILGAGLYGEFALLDGGRSLISDGSGDSDLLTRDSDINYSWLAGFEYTFPVEITIVAEYFRNGEGYTSEEREDYYTALESLDIIDAEHYSIYRPGYFDTDYILLNLIYSQYDLFIDCTLSGLYGLNSNSLTTITSVSWSPSGSLKLELGYTGLFSLDDDEFDENSLSPINNIMTFSVTYSF